MLADRYDYKTPWELQREEAEREEQERLQERQRQKEEKQQAHNLLVRKCLSLTLMIVMGSYAATVFRSEAYATAGRQLVLMKQEEKLLRGQNDELKIEVEELKGPSRIIRLAQQRLGMSVARTNIYLKGN